MKGQIEVIEFPGGDSSHEQTYLGPDFSDGNAGQIPVTLRFVDLNGDGRLDMLIQAQGSSFVLLNDGKRFVPVPAGEENQIKQRLHQLDDSKVERFQYLPSFA